MTHYESFSQFYDLFTHTVDYKSRANYFHNLIEPHIGEQKMLLDLACGTGSLSLEMLELGYDVIAVDSSVGMLGAAQQKAYSLEKQILFLNQEMEQLDLYGTINACVCALDSLNHLPSYNAFVKTLSRVSLFLEAGGVFVFDTNTPFKHKEILADNCFVYEQDDVVCVWQNNTEDLVTEISLDFFKKEKNGLYSRESEIFFERAFTMQEIKTAIKEAGLSLLNVYENDSMDEATEKSERWIFIAKKEI